MVDDGPELSKVLATLREQLALARKQGEGHDLRFEMDEIEVELNVALTTEGTGNLEVKFWVVTAAMGGKLSQVATQKIKLKMKLAGDSTLIGGNDTRSSTAGNDRR